MNELKVTRVILYNEDESLTNEGHSICMRIEREIKGLIEQLTKNGEISVIEAVSLIHQTVEIIGARIILENRRKASKSRP